MNIISGYLTDLHVHSSFSYDSDESMEKYIEKAIAQGDKRIGFVSITITTVFWREKKLRFAIRKLIKEKQTG